MPSLHSERQLMRIPSAIKCLNISSDRIQEVNHMLLTVLPEEAMCFFFGLLIVFEDAVGLLHEGAGVGVFVPQIS